MNLPAYFEHYKILKSNDWVIDSQKNVNICDIDVFNKENYSPDMKTDLYICKKNHFTLKIYECDGINIHIWLFKDLCIGSLYLDNIDKDIMLDIETSIDIHEETVKILKELINIL